MLRPSPLERFVIGSMVGDALGLPFERLSRRRVAALMGNRSLRHRMVLGLGLVSDDTEHALMTISAFRASGGDADAFGRALACRLRWWALALPPGAGRATILACGRLLLGCSHLASGVNSAGNGPVMRAGVLGLLCDSPQQLGQFVRVASRITHTDERAEHGALAVALAARVAGEKSPVPIDVRYREAIEAELPQGDMRGAIINAIESVRAGESTTVFADRCGCGRGVSGFVMHTVPIALHAWLRCPASFEDGVAGAIRLGGDTDTCAAVVGGLLGLNLDVPDRLVANIADFPFSPAAARDVARRSTPKYVRWRPAALPLRNVLFLAIVLIHVVRRLLPPYG